MDHGLANGGDTASFAARPSPSDEFDRVVELAALALGAPVAVICAGPTSVVRDRSGGSVDEVRTVVDAITEVPFDTDRPAWRAIRLPTGRVWSFIRVRIPTTDQSLDGQLIVADRADRSGATEAHIAMLDHIAAIAAAEFARNADVGVDPAPSEGRRRIIDGINEGIVLHDANGVIREWNVAAERLLGLVGTEIDGARATDPKFLAVRLDGTRVPDDERPSAIARRTGERVDGVVAGLDRPDGERIWLRLSAQPIHDVDGVSVISTFIDVTAEIVERLQNERLEAALARNARFAETCLESLDQGMMLVDGDGAVSICNPAALRILGCSPEEVLDMWHSDDWEVQHEDGGALAFLDRPIVKAVATGRPVHGEVVSWRRKDGERVLLRMSCVPDADGEGALVIAFSDVTEQRRARQLLDATLATAPAGLAILDINGLVTRCNAELARQAGRTEDELSGTRVFDLIHPDDRLEGHVQRELLMKGDPARASFDHRINRPDGEDLWVHTELAVIGTSDPPLVIAATFDITEQRRMVLDLSRFSHLFDHSNDMITVIDAAGEVLYSSPATGRILGHPDGYRDPAGIFGMIHPDDVPGAAASLESLMASAEDVAPFTARTRTVDGRWLWIEFSGANLLDEPAVEGLLIIGRDVTQRVELAAELEERATHDTLTGLANRLGLRRVLDDVAGGFIGAERPVGLCYLDLDGFKRVNDAFGHEAGDEILTVVADALRRCLRDGDLAARVGGDEFVIVLDPVDDVDDALDRATELRDALLAALDARLGERLVGVSVGVAISRPEDDSSSLLRRADAAMYRSKALGTSAVIAASEQVSAGAS